MTSIEHSAGAVDEAARRRLAPARLVRSAGSAARRVLNAPASYVIGPIFQREVRAAGRRRGTYITRFVYIGVVLLVLSLVYLGVRSSSSATSTVQRIQELQQLAPAIAVSLFWAQFVLMVLIAPILTAGAVCDEKRGRTLAALMTTPLTSGQIIMGKLSARTVQLVILALCATPVLLAIRIFGGLEASLIIAAALTTVSTALLAASVGVLLSCWHSRAAPVVMFSLLVLGLIQAAPFTLWGILVSNNLIDESLPIAVFGTCAPAVLFEASFQSTGESFVDVIGINLSEFPGLWAWTAVNLAAFNAVYNLVWILLICALASTTLRRVMVAEAGGSALGRLPLIDGLLGVDRRGRFRLLRFILAVSLPSVLLLGVIVAWSGQGANLFGVVLTAFVLLGLNIALLVAGTLRARRVRARLATKPPDVSSATPRICAQCGYSLAGLEPGEACPECGGSSVRSDPRAEGEETFAVSRTVGHRPVLWRELRQRTFGGRLISLRLGRASVLCLTLVLAVLISFWQVSDAQLTDLSSAFGYAGGDALAVWVKLALVVAVLVAGVVLALRGPLRLRFPVKMAYLAGAVIIAAMYMYIVEGFDDTGLTPFIATVASVGLLLQASVMTTAGIAGERESLTWETLLTTALSPTEILSGKFLGALRRMMLIPALVFAHALLAMSFGALHPVGVVTIMLTLLGPAALLAGTGVFFSLVFRKSTRAAVANLALALTLWGGSWLVLLLIDVFDPFFEVESLYNVNYTLSPVAMSFTCADAFTTDSTAYRFVQLRHPVSVADYRVPVTVLNTTAVFAGYAAAGLSAVAAAIYFFPSAGGRSS